VNYAQKNLSALAGVRAPSAPLATPMASSTLKQLRNSVHTIEKRRLKGGVQPPLT